MNARLREPADRTPAARVRLLVAMLVVVVASLGVGLAIGAMSKGGPRSQPPAPPLAAGAAARTGSIPAVPALRKIATLPALRSRPKHASPTVAGSVARATVSGRITQQSSVAPALSAPSSPSPTRSAPSHSEGGAVHHETEGGA